MSWIERLLEAFPGIQEYEDDLRDQWQSRWHRAEWQRMLRTLERSAVDGDAVTIVSGELHYATRGEMPFRSGNVLHQLVASGIAHRAPSKSSAILLGVLAGLGENPLPGQRIRLEPLPGHRRIYMAERNYLVLARRQENWFAAWELEESGRTPAMPL